MRLRVRYFAVGGGGGGVKKHRSRGMGTAEGTNMALLTEDLGT